MTTKLDRKLQSIARRKLGEHVVMTGVVCLAPRQYRAYQRTDSTWAIEGADDVALTSGMRKADRRWNSTVDTVKVQNGVVSACTDSVCNCDRSAWHQVDHDIRRAIRVAKDTLAAAEDRGVEVRHFQRVEVRAGLWAYDVAAIRNGNTWQAITCEFYGVK